jgi:2-dehydro-3-deoxyglucarate aldolase
MTHNFKQRLTRGELLVGTMLTLPCPEAAELLSQVGFDWLFLDAEHSTFEAHDLLAILQAASASTSCLVRLSSAGEVPIKKALDIGADGVIVPLVNTARQAEEVVRFAKYAPLGARGVGVGRAHGYGLRFQEHIDTANQETVVVVQAEHVDAVNNIQSIVQVPGIDAVLIGPYDLSASLGRLGQVDHPQVVEAIDHVTRACLDAGVRLGIFGMTPQAVKPYVDRGYTLVVVGLDTMLMAQSAKNLLDELKPKNEQRER